MATFSPTWVTEHPACADPLPAVSDGQLLDLFIKHKDDWAFEELVRRHGRMVLGVCRRVLDNPHDAEDCFQAVFLVLVRKATTILPREMVGNWLYGVAYRTALEAKKMAARRRIRERKKFDMPRPDADVDRWEDLRPLLDAELSRLPERYRFVLIACDLEGRTRKEVARVLRLPEGTVASRLARARALLAKRLTRYKMVISAGMLATLLTEHASACDLPPSLVASTTEAAAQLAAGKSADGLISGNVAALMNAALKSMLIAKLKIASVAVLALFLLAIGIGALLPSALAERKGGFADTVVAAKKEKPTSVYDCVIEKLDPAKMKVHAAKLDVEGGANVTYEFDVEPTAAISIDGKDARLADLKLHAYVNVEFEQTADGRNQAVRIEAISDAFAGAVHAITDDRVTIQPDKDKEKTYDLDPNAKVVIDGKKAKLGDVKAKMRVALRVSSGKPRVVGIHAAGPMVAGVVKTIDGKSLSLGTDDFAVTPDTLVLVDGKRGKLADVRAGMAVTLQSSADTERRTVVAIVTAK